MKTKKWLFVAIIGGMSICSCKKEEKAVSPPVPGNEFMTTIELRFENTADANDTIWASWQDLTPDDTNPPDTTLAFINFTKNTTYKASVYFLDETKSPAQDITSEIRDRGNYHLYVFFQTGAISGNITITPTDHDTNSPPLPIGLEDTFTVADTICSGRLEGVLRHQPNSKNGTFAPGSTDSDVFFTVNIIP